MRHPTASAVAVVTILLLSACEGPAPAEVEAPSVVLEALFRATVLADGTQEVTGLVGPGAHYALARPAVWNGRLVLYAHGYTDPAQPVELPAGPSVEAIRSGLLGLGFAVAYSSFSENGFALGDGVQRTRQLAGLFAEAFEEPDRTYLMGHSLGGAVVLMLAEGNPGKFDGALPICTFVGGAHRQIDYITNVRLLFDLHFPGLLPGSVFEMPAGVDFAGDVAPAILAAVLSPTGLPRAAALAAVDQVGIVYSSPLELALSLASALRYQIVGTNDLIGRTHGRIPFDNTETVYTVGGVPNATLNALVPRYSSTPDADNYLDRYYEPSGRLRVPVLTLHTTADPDVPFAHEAAYAATAAAAGHSDMLVQREIPRFGHCNITPDEHVAALADLVAWAELGIVPAP